MSDNNYHVGDYTLKVCGDMDLSCAGAKSTIRATGEESTMMIAAEKTVGIFSGSAFAAVENDEPEAGSATLQAGETGKVTLAAGPVLSGVSIKLQGPELLELSVGAPGVGASIIMTPESITFKVAETSLTLSPEGIIEDVAEVTREVTVEGHNFTAAETEMNIGVEGFVMEGPSVEGEFEGGTVTNETLGECLSDAMKSMEAGITMMV